MPNVLSLKKSNCKNCYKCIRHCPVKAIRFSGQQAHIMSNECILCGQCFVVCPQNAKEILDSTEAVQVMLHGSSPVIASLAPSFYACWDSCGINSMRKALRELGFADVEETALGATLVKREYEKQVAEKKQDIIITTACHSVNLLIQKYFPDLRQYMSPVMSPMIAHSMDIKRRIPDAKTVFIGPCVAKKDEAVGTYVDAVLTFEELDIMLQDAGIKIEPETEESEAGRARSFPVPGGIISCMDFPEDSDYVYFNIDGAANCIDALRDIESGKVNRCFIEMSACAGGCINGPIMEKYINSPVRHICSVLKNAKKEDFDIPQPQDGSLFMQHVVPELRLDQPSDKEIHEILAKLGKNTPASELNCGACGYDTCRDKAVAIFRGSSDYSMCLPSMMERTESFTEKILNNMPSGVIVVNEDLEVQQINRPALKLLNISYESDVLGENVVRILDTAPFLTVLERGKALKNQRSYFSDYDKYLDQTIVYDRSSHILIDIIYDVTEEEEQRSLKNKLGRETVQIADRVISNQMRIVQEIASLLGETTAETKIALTKLKETMGYNEDK